MNSDKLFETITKEKFDAYESVRESGVTNMWNVDLVSQISGLSEEEILLIIKNYSILADKYLKEEN